MGLVRAFESWVNERQPPRRENYQSAEEYRAASREYIYGEDPADK